MSKTAQLALKLVLLALMGLIVGLPLLQPVLVCGDDFPGHLAHVIEHDRLLSQGVWYSRWAPDLAFGYGYPAFNFYPPLAHYLAMAIHRLGLSTTHALNVTMALAFMIAGPAMYLLARRIYGDQAGMVAGLAYAFAPYLAHNALRRFALNEALAMSVAPLVLWAFARLDADSPRFPRGRVVLAALAYAALILTHNLMALLLTPLLIGYLFVAWWVQGRPRAMIGRAAAAGALAVGLSAFFWLPFVTEIGWVQSWRATILDLTGEPLYPLHFVSLRDLLWPKMLWPDYRLGNPLVQRLVGLPQAILAAIGLALVWRRPSRLARAAAALFGLTLLSAMFLITPASRPLWDNLRAIQIVQFPWRFLALASLSLALLAGAGWASFKCQISNFKFQKAAVVARDAALVALLLAWTLPWLRPFTCGVDANPSGAFLLWVDRHHVGGGSGGEFLPNWIETAPVESPLEADLLAGKPLDRLNRASRPDGARAGWLSSKPLASSWEIDSSKAFTAFFNNLYYPGWNVYVDGTPAPISLTPSTGLMVADIPAGRHIITLRLDSTRGQTLGNLISLASVLAALALIASQISNFVAADPCEGFRLNLCKGESLPSDTPHGSTVAPAWEWVALGGIGIVALAARLTLAAIAPPGPALPATMTRIAPDGSEPVRLVGYEFSTPAVKAGQPLTVTLYWQSQSLLLTSYKSFVHVTDASGNMVAQSDVVPDNWTRPTTTWLPGEWIADPHRLDVSQPGPLEVWAGMYDPATAQRLNLARDGSGRVRLGALLP